MTGPELKNIVDNSNFTIDEIVSKSGIPLRSLYNIFDSPKPVKQYRLDALEFLLPNIAKSSTKPSSEITDKAYELVVSTMRELIDVLKEDNSVYRKIIDKGLQANAISFDMVKADLLKK